MAGTSPITYTESLPGEQAYFRLFESTGWNTGYRLKPTELYEALTHSWHSVNAYDSSTLVGTGRVISDGILHALIVDVIVLPQYQRQGIGTNIMLRLLDKCRRYAVRDVQLFCARDKAPFYERLGFRARPLGAPGMELWMGS
jgi:GNAT superfamily N-acetyltransferase